MTTTPLPPLPEMQVLFTVAETQAYATQSRADLEAALSEVVGCFDAAEAEGLIDVLTWTTDARLKDLVERRLMHALYAARTALKGSNHD